jgi:hypothetical protein
MIVIVPAAEMRPLHLKEGELGTAMFAVEGWLQQIKKKRE